MYFQLMKFFSNSLPKMIGEGLEAVVELELFVVKIILISELFDKVINIDTIIPYRLYFEQFLRIIFI